MPAETAVEWHQQKWRSNGIVVDPEDGVALEEWACEECDVTRRCYPHVGPPKRAWHGTRGG